MSDRNITTEELAAQKAAVRDKKRFVRLTHDGVSCICEPRDVEDLVADSEPGDYTTRDVWMTQAEFDALPEFEGY